MGTELFGADWPLVKDAFVITGLALTAGVGGTWLLLRRKGKSTTGAAAEDAANKTPGNLEDRVRVLERIATDRPADLAEEIESLREKKVEA